MEGVGVMSLAFQVFAGCITGYQLLLEARDMPERFEYLRIRLQLEQYRLLDWAIAANLATDAYSISSEAHPSHKATMDVLSQIHALLSNLESISKCYKLTLCADNTDRRIAPLTGLANDAWEPQRATREDLLRRALATAHHKPTFNLSKRLRWAVFHAKQFEQLVSQLAELNKLMLDFLDTEAKRRHHELQQITYLQVVETNNKLENLIEVVACLGRKGDLAAGRTSPDGSHHNMATLARFKARALAALDPEGASKVAVPVGLQAEMAHKLDFSAWHPLPGRSDDTKGREQRVVGLYGGAQVWMETRYYDGPLAHQPWIEQRIARLCTLLQDANKPHDMFNVPLCHGYLHDPERSRFGLVFRSLDSTTSCKGPPSTLYDRLSTEKKPSLTLRLSMARKLAVSLRYLHAASWLHKGLRSDNILLGRPHDLSSLIISGFEYSRPANPGEMTDVPTDNRQDELYRHPNVQFDVPRDEHYHFSRAHDMYALGVVLFEIGTWHPIHEFLGISLHRLIRRPDIRAVQARLLSEDSMSTLEAETGDRFAQLVRRCLESDMEGQGAADNPTDPWNLIIEGLTKIIV